MEEYARKWGEDLGRNILTHANRVVQEGNPVARLLAPPTETTSHSRVFYARGRGSQRGGPRGRGQPANRRGRTRGAGGRGGVSRPGVEPTSRQAGKGTPEAGGPKPGRGRTSRRNSKRKSAKDALEGELASLREQLRDSQAETASLRTALSEMEAKLALLGPTPSMVAVGEGEESALLGMEEGESLLLYDSHFHLDRLQKRTRVNWTPGEAVTQTVVPPPNTDLSVGGGMMVFCDPLNFPTDGEVQRLRHGSKFGVALGIHPSHSKGNVERFAPVIVDISRRVQGGMIDGVGEIGLDPQGGSPESQERLVSMFLPILKPDIPLILHVRGKGERDQGYQYGRALGLLERAGVDPKQIIQLHCFSGTRETVRTWSSRFPNCFYSFSGLTAKFSPEQTEALRQVPSDRLLVETDAPYLAVRRTVGCNFPSYLGELVQLIARLRGTDEGSLASLTIQNARVCFRSGKEVAGRKFDDHSLPPA